MPLDPVIAGGFRGLQLQDPLEQYGRISQIQQAQQQNQLAALKMQEYQREQESVNALNRAYADAYNPQTGDVDINRLRQSLATGGYGAKIPAIEKQLGEAQAQRLTLGKAETELVGAKLAQSRTLLDTIDPSGPNAPQQFMAWHEANHSDPVLGPVLQRMGVTAEQSRARISQAVSQGPEAIANLIAQSREGQTKFAEQFKPMQLPPNTTVYDPRAQKGVYTSPAAPEKDQLGARLQDRFVPVGKLVFDRQEQKYITPPQTAIAATQDRPAPAPGGPATRAPATRGGATAGGKPAEPAGKPANVTEQQASTATQRLLRRAQEISTVLSANKKAEAPTALEAGMENIPLLSRATNLVRSTDRQIVSSAQDDILDALLYLSTGAAYNKEQLAQQKSAYLPSWSDDPPTRQVKRQRLTQAIEGARVRAGRAWSPELDAAMQQLLASPVMGAAAPAAGAPPTGARPSLDSIFK
jgi:hypothetical protein